MRWRSFPNINTTTLLTFVLEANGSRIQHCFHELLCRHLAAALLLGTLLLRFAVTHTDTMDTRLMVKLRERIHDACDSTFRC
jgi:hypothetical protein